MVSGESKILLNLCSQVVWLVFLLLFLVLLRIESATEVEGEKCSSLEYTGLMLNLMVGMCWILCLVGGLSCCEKFSGCSFF